MFMIKKFLLFILFVLLSILIAGIYGLIHNQVTYTIAPEYFTHFKFIQFDLPEYFTRDERMGAAIVGWRASWWMGIPIGLIIGGLWLWESSISFQTRYRALGVVLLSTLSLGLLGAIYGYFQYSPDPQKYYETISFTGFSDRLNESLNAMTQPYAYFRAGVIHTSSYIGGALGLVLGSGFLWKSRDTYRKQMDI